jgi:integrase
MDAALVEANPCHRLKKRGVENVGRRVLTDAEIKLFWLGIVEPASTRRTGLGLRLALLTGARIGEVAAISRDELDIREPHSAAWLIPGTRTKNGRDHLVPLSPLARDTVLELLAMIEAGERFLLPTRSQGRDGPMRGNSLTQAMANFADRISDSADAGKTWRAEAPSPHDLRRTVETRLAAMGVSRKIRDAVLNHITPGIGAKHYNLHDYAPEKRAALNRWSLAVAAILDPAAAPVVDLEAVRKRGGAA